MSTSTLIASVPGVVDAAVTVVGTVTVAAVVGFVYRDARQVGVDRPRLWSGIVGATCTIGLITYLLVPSVPIAGLLVVVLAGPVFYLFERDDATHGAPPASPRTLADGPGGEASDRPAETTEE